MEGVFADIEQRAHIVEAGERGTGPEFFPSPFMLPRAIRDYFARQSDVVRAAAVFLFGLAVTLALFAATRSLGAARTT